MILGIDASRAIKKEKTGVEWYSFFLLRAMEKLTPPGWKVRCYVPSLPPTPHPNPLPHGDREIKESPPPLMGGVRGGWHHDEGNWEWKILKWIGRGWTQGRLSLEMMKSPPDVLFVPSHTIPLIHPERTITTVHDVVFLAHPELYDPDDLADQKRGLEFALNFAKKIIVPSKATREDVVKAGAKEGQVVVVPHGVDMAISNSLVAISKSNSQLPIANSKYILFIGRIEKKKNVLGLIHAFRRLIDSRDANNESSANLRISNSQIRKFGSDSQFAPLKLVLAGSLGYGSEDILQAIKTFKLENHVVHLGWVDRASYHALLMSASALILPSFGEGFGLPVLEAMAVGIPVIASDISALREVGGNAVQFVNPYDSQSIAQGIQTVLQNEMLQSEMIKKGKERAREYSWDKTARETWNVICPR